MSNITTLQFQSHTLQPIQKDNQIWLTSSDLAIALNYSDSRSVNKIYNQYSEEFSMCMSRVVDSTTVKGLPFQTRLFSLRGAHLIAMFSRTKVAKDFRKWVLDVLDKEVSNPQTELIESEKTYTITLTDSELCSLAWLWRAADFMRSKIEEIEVPLRALNSGYAANFYSMSTEYKRVLQRTKIILERETRVINPHPTWMKDSNWRYALESLRS